MLDKQVVNFNRYHYGGGADELSSDDPPAGIHSLLNVTDFRYVNLVVLVGGMCSQISSIHSLDPASPRTRRGRSFAVCSLNVARLQSCDLPAVPTYFLAVSYLVTLVYFRDEPSLPFNWAEINEFLFPLKNGAGKIAAKND